MANVYMIGFGAVLKTRPKVKVSGSVAEIKKVQYSKGFEDM